MECSFDNGLIVKVDFLVDYTGKFFGENDMLLTAVPAFAGDGLTVRHDGTIESIEFSEFTVNYKNYMEVNGILLPKKIDIKGNNFLLRIAVNKWEI